MVAVQIIYCHHTSTLFQIHIFRLFASQNVGKTHCSISIDCVGSWRKSKSIVITVIEHTIFHFSNTNNKDTARTDTVSQDTVNKDTTRTDTANVIITLLRPIIHTQASSTVRWQHSHLQLLLNSSNHKTIILMINLVFFFSTTVFV